MSLYLVKLYKIIKLILALNVNIVVFKRIAYLVHQVITDLSNKFKFIMDII